MPGVDVIGVGDVDIVPCYDRTIQLVHVTPHAH
jgi:hypothetical protein